MVERRARLRAGHFRAPCADRDASLVSQQVQSLSSVPVSRLRALRRAPTEMQAADILRIVQDTLGTEHRRASRAADFLRTRRACAARARRRGCRSSFPRRFAARVEAGALIGRERGALRPVPAARAGRAGRAAVVCVGAQSPAGTSPGCPSSLALVPPPLPTPPTSFPSSFLGFLLIFLLLV